MVKVLTVTLSDTEYEILNKLDKLEGKNGERLHSLLRYFIRTHPSLKSDYYGLKREETKEKLEQGLKDIWKAYEKTINPIEACSPEKVEKLVKDLSEMNVIHVVGKNTYIPTSEFRGVWKMVFHDIAAESPEMDEYNAACITTLLLLDEFSIGTMGRDDLRDATILLNEGWLFVYATAKKRAREFMKTKKLHP
jgi:hypothetical protein